MCVCVCVGRSMSDSESDLGLLGGTEIGNLVGEGKRQL